MQFAPLTALMFFFTIMVVVVALRCVLIALRGARYSVTAATVTDWFYKHQVMAVDLGDDV